MAVSMIGPKFYAFGRDGKPLAFGKVYTYKARTNEPKSTYQSEDGVVANTNPVILNGEGYADIYLNGSYKIVIKDKGGSEVWTEDPVTAISATEWVNCVAAYYLSPNSLKINGNVTDIFDSGRRIRLDDSGKYNYSTIVDSIFSGDYTTITISDDVSSTELIGACASIVGSNSYIPSEVNSFFNLRNTEPKRDWQQVGVLGRTEPGKDGGVFYYDPEDKVSQDNNKNIIVTSGGNRWKKLLGSASNLNYGTEVGNVLLIEELNGLPALPAIDGSNLLNVGSDVESASETILGIAKIATQEQVENGLDDTTIITPLKLNKKLADISETSTSYVSLSSASVLEFVDKYLPRDINKFSAISSSNSASGTLIDAETSGYFDLVLPYMVLIGDSISEGHPALHGRLHPTGTAGYDSGYVSQPGQLSYEFQKRFNVPVINQGIGGETSTQVKARWPRDVLAQTFNPGDGRGSKTLEFGGQLPHAVYLHVGINDVFVGIPVSTIKDNFTYFAQSCRDNGIVLILDNIGVQSNISAGQTADAKSINSWLTGDFKINFPEVQVIDYLDWSSNGTGYLNTLKPGAFADSVHPNKSGYASFASYSASKIIKPVFLKSITLNSTTDGTPGSFSRIIGFEFNQSKYMISGPIATFSVGNLINGDNPISRLVPTNYEIISGLGGNQYSGFAEITAELGNRQDKAVFMPSYASGGSIGSSNVVAAGVILNADIAPPNGYLSFGITSTDTGDIANGNVTVNLTSAATHIVIVMVGISPVYESEKFTPRWTSGNIPNGQSSWVINLRDAAGVNTIDPIKHNYQIIAYNFL